MLRKIKRINRTLYRKGIFSTEIKYLRTGYTIQIPVPSPTSTSTNITNIMETLTKGDDYDEFMGGKVFIRNLRMQYFLRAPTTLNFDAMVRVMVVRDTQPANANTPPQLNTINDFYIASIPTSQSDADLNFMMWKHINSNSAGRFQILYNRVHIVNGDYQSYYGKNHFVKKTIKVMKPWHSAAREATPIMDARGVGQLYLITFSNAIVANGSDAPFLNIAWRASYTDV